MAQIKTGKSAPTSVPAPGNAHFVLGSRPAVLRSPSLTRIKPAKDAAVREYGKSPPLAGDTGLSGQS